MMLIKSILVPCISLIASVRCMPLAPDGSGKPPQSTRYLATRSGSALVDSNNNNHNNSLHPWEPDTSLRARDVTQTYPFGTFTVQSTGPTLASSGTYPRMIRLASGTILAISSTTSGSTKVLQVTQSTDDGATFTHLSDVATSTGDLSNGFLLQLPSGVILAAFRNHDVDAASGAYTYYRITVCSSADGGATWAFAGQAAETAASTTTLNGLWEPFMRLAANGGDGDVVQLTYSGELSADNQETFLVTSRDAGVTWTAPAENLHLHDDATQAWRDGMNGIIATTDAATGADALVMVFEVGRSGAFDVEYVLSYDDGATWGHRGVVYKPARNNAGAPQIATIGGGGGDGNNLAVVFMTDEDISPSETDWANKADIKVVFAPELGDRAISWDPSPMTVADQPN
ncbi:glycoside hydrolase family 93 protein [Xylariomycetidae sp. FL2044]|nr:glycoside hydrolase family 93 protein [Xylariomycetidae sp. FL2044]